jgi:hypothetical protein
LKSPRIPRSVGDILPDALPQLVERLAEVRLRQHWATTVGAEVARRTHPGLLVEGCLTVVVDNSPWLHELTLRQSEVLALIRRECSSVRALRLTVGPLPAEERDRAVVSRSAPLSQHDQHEIEEATAIISDAALAAAARRLLTRAHQARGASDLTR